MFGKNPVAKNEIKGDGRTLHIVEGSPFYTIQGEGPFAGMPAVFLRLHGCPLRCFFCDTEFSRPEDPILDVSRILEEIEKCAPKHCQLIVITGGEPVRQNLEPLLEELEEAGWLVQIETAGILWQDCLVGTRIIVSPKTPTIHPKIEEYAHAYKYVIRDGEVDEQDGLPLTNTQVEGGKPSRLARPKGVPFGGIFLSPMDEQDLVKNAKNTSAVGKLAMMYGYRAGIQLHKLMDLP